MTSATMHASLLNQRSKTGKDLVLLLFALVMGLSYVVLGPVLWGYVLATAWGLMVSPTWHLPGITTLQGAAAVIMVLLVRAPYAAAPKPNQKPEEHFLNAITSWLKPVGALLVVHILASILF